MDNSNRTRKSNINKQNTDGNKVSKELNFLMMKPESAESLNDRS